MRSLRTWTAFAGRSDARRVADKSPCFGTIVQSAFYPDSPHGYFNRDWNEHGQEVDAAERPLSRDAQGYLFCREQDPEDASEDGEGGAVERAAKGLHQTSP